MTDRPIAGDLPVGVANLNGDVYRFLLARGQTLELDLGPLRDLPVLRDRASGPDLFADAYVSEGQLRWPSGPRLGWADVRAAARAAPARGFTVDTHLFRELGELLVGRDSTAALELVKNAYDADATSVTLDGTGLLAGDGSLVVVDDGNGMTRHRFVSAFLRVASRSKEGEDRRSVRYSRRFTGEKGIGRLAAHKLASVLTVTSVPDLAHPAAPGDLPGPDTEEQDRVGVSAVIDWDLIEAQGSLEDLTNGLTVESVEPSPADPSGSAFELRRFRGAWTEQQVTRFVREMRESQPPGVLADPNACPALAEPALLPSPLVRDTSPSDPGFQVRLAGDLDAGEDFFPLASQDFQWLLEIDATTDTVQYQVTPVAAYAKTEPLARAYRFRRASLLKGRPSFHVRVFTYPNASTRRGPLRSFVRSSTGVRVYMEGFRVLPYGESSDDWLGIDREYRTGARSYTIDLDPDSDPLVTDKEGLSATGNTGYVGAVFLVEGQASGLRSLVNREGFVPDEAFDTLVDLVSTGIKLTVRVRRAVNLAAEERERDARLAAALVARDRDGQSDTDGPVVESPPAPEDPPPAPDPKTVRVAASEALARAEAAAAQLRAHGTPAASPAQLADVVAGFAVATADLERLQAQQADLRVLASVGLQLGTFIHDINGLLGQARTVRELLEPLAQDEGLGRPQRARVRKVGKALDDLAQALDRQSSYLTDVVSTDSRRRRRRVDVADRLGVSRRLLTVELGRRSVELDTELPPGLKTPPMFPAEVTVLLNNLLTNAIKNAGSPGRVLVSGESLGQRGLTLRISNTGTAVDLRDAERWFLPFETTTTIVDEVLGQGLGLGLPITRALLDDYRGNIAFTTPRRGFATEIQVDLPDPQELR